MSFEFRMFHGPSDWGWVQQHSKLHRVEDTQGIVAVDTEKNETVAACILDTWKARSVNAHIIIKAPQVIRHGFFMEVADYVFGYAGKEVMIGMISADNEPVAKLGKSVGFEEAGRIPEGVAPGVDIVVVYLTKDACPFYRGDSDELRGTRSAASA